MSIIKFLVELYLVILILRFLLQLFTANPYNPFCRWIFKLTSPVVTPVEKILPTHSNFSWACLLVILLLKAIELLVLIWIALQTWPHVGGLILVALGELLYLTTDIFFFCIIAQAILSWLAMINHRYFSIQEVLAILTAPLLRPAQRLIPPIGGLDISAIPVLILLQLIKFYLFVPIISFGMQLIFS